MIPGTVRIAGIPFQIERSEPPSGSGPRYSGAITYDVPRIWIDSSLQSWRQRKVLLHELIHGALNLFGQPDHKEEIVEALENGLWAIFKDNPELVDVIFREQDEK